MSPLKVIIPLFIVLGILQATVLSLPFVYWRFAGYMGPINKFLFGSFLLFLAFVAHPLLIITLITFTIAPTLLSLRHNLTSRLSTAYTALVPASISTLSATDLLSSIPFIGNGSDDIHAPKTNRDWLLTLLSSYVGWKTLGTLPSLMMLLVLLSLWKGREAGGDRGWLAKGLRGGERQRRENAGAKRCTTTDVSTRSGRTDVQVVG
ncbi:hypothetical protein E8E12_002355 [Didymella heteroderae]|uniref:Uncharacterized protein n=1 Tax=Didymella heteroderae TaxID=1769908 RepID=A0A9P5BWN1_9PLEO|nr:hypothetical protein E8E12_002355 [Didymella heteroderae]